jgi:hypothetical protein
MIDLQESHTGKYLFKVLKNTLSEFEIYEYIQR